MIGWSIIWRWRGRSRGPRASVAIQGWWERDVSREIPWLFIYVTVVLGDVGAYWIVAHCEAGLREVFSRKAARYSCYDTSIFINIILPMYHLKGEHLSRKEPIAGS